MTFQAPATGRSPSPRSAARQGKAAAPGIAHTPPKPPDIGELIARLRFAPQEGHIWLDNQRAALIHLSTLESLRCELIDALGLREARGFLTRMGFSSGTRDATEARKLHPQGAARDAFIFGLKLRTLQGVLMMEPTDLMIDIPNGKFRAEIQWRGSFEVDSHVSVYGVSNDPVCWMQTGYLCAYASSFMGRTILFREVECLGAGGGLCRAVGKPIEDWTDAEDDIRPLQPEAFANRFSTLRKAAPNVAEANSLPMPTELVGASGGFIAACHLLKKVASTNATVLFLGETGVGKEVFARTLHQISRRANCPFIALNCAAIPEGLVEAELFGVEKGAYTGAVTSRPGRFERANGGTLFLDEVGTLTGPAQTKLLRAIQERRIERVGDTMSRPVDIRIIAATNVDLMEAVKAGTFREDLLYRLNVFPITIPPLRERRADIPLLTDHFLHRFAKLHGKDVNGFTERAWMALYEYDYPGNIRELENIIERAVVMADGDGQPVDLHHLRLPVTAMLRVGDGGTLEREGRGGLSDHPALAPLLAQVLENKISLQDVDDLLMQEAVNRAKGNLSLASRLLGMTRPQLAYRLKKGQPETDEEFGTDSSTSP